MSLDPPRPPALSGAETFDGLDASVVDFWQFAMSDLRTNNVRGYLAEFLVARAVGARGLRVEWEPWDVTAPDGTKIEVKSSGYMQAWAQKKLSKPVYKVAAAYGWDGATGAWSVEQGFHADVYVFGLQTATSHQGYKPLDTAQWQFYVADQTVVEAQAGAQMSLTTLARLCGAPHQYEELAGAIALAAQRVQSLRG